MTLGKPMGNGIPVSGPAADSEVHRAFSDALPYFNIFGGNTVSMAAASAVLTVLEDERLPAHSEEVGAQSRADLQELATTHEVIRDVHGAGLFTGFELVEDRDSRTPATGIALELLEQLRERGVLTSMAGPASNVLTLRPSLAFTAGDIPWVVDALEASLTAMHH